MGRNLENTTSLVLKAKVTYSPLFDHQEGMNHPSELFTLFALTQRQEMYIRISKTYVNPLFVD